MKVEKNAEESTNHANLALQLSETESVKRESKSRQAAFLWGRNEDVPSLTPPELPGGQISGNELCM